MRILGIDPGTRFLGWGVIEADGPRLLAHGFGVLKASPRSDLADRLVVLAAGLREVIALHRPEVAAVEEAFYGRDARATLRLGEGRGAAILVLSEAGLRVTGYANNVVKRAVTGGGRATKEHVRSMVVRMLALAQAPESLDASDALAVALCHHQRRGLDGLGEGGPSPRIRDAIRRARRGGR